MSFSIVIPLYNKQNTIGATIDSVVEQDYADFEIVVVNDGSTDASLDIVKDIEDGRIRIISTINTGPSFARNIGVLASCNEWIVFLDADDLMMPGALRRFDECITASDGIDVCAGNYLLRHQNKDILFSDKYRIGVLKDAYKEWFFARFMPCAGTCAFRREVLKRHLFNTNLRRYEDASVLLDIMRESRIYRFPEPVMIYNRDESSASAPRKDIKEDFLGHLSFDGKSRWEKLLLYQFYIEAKNIYPEQAREIYPDIEKKYFLLKSAYHIMNRIRHICR